MTLDKKVFQQDAHHMLTNRLSFVHQMPLPVGGSQMNKFEQVSSDGYKMSLAGGLGVRCLMSRGPGLGGPMLDGLMCRVGGGVHSEVKCIVGNGHRGPPLP